MNENFGIFFNEFGRDADITRGAAAIVQARVILNLPTQSVDAFEIGVEIGQPNCLITTSATGNIKRRDRITIDGSTYEIERIRHDGTGITTLYLK